VKKSKAKHPTTIMPASVENWCLLMVIPVARVRCAMASLAQSPYSARKDGPIDWRTAEAVGFRPAAVTRLTHTHGGSGRRVLAILLETGATIQGSICSQTGTFGGLTSKR
jgi:hypothetical protein